MDNTAQYWVEGLLTFGIVAVFWIVAMLPLFYGSTPFKRWKAWRAARRKKRDDDEWGMNG
jgi:ABC-type Co2+ transport system permease subunit